MKYNAPLNAVSPNESYIDGNPEYGIEGSLVPAAAIEAPQREIVAAIKAAGLTPTEKNQEQLAQAIRKLAKEQAADNALKLSTPRRINNVGFDGTRDITVFDNTKQPLSEKDKPNGYAGLDNNSKINNNKLYDTVATTVGYIEDIDKAWYKFCHFKTSPETKGKMPDFANKFTNTLCYYDGGDVYYQHSFAELGEYAVRIGVKSKNFWEPWYYSISHTGIPVGSIFPSICPPDNRFRSKYIILTHGRYDYNQGLIDREDFGYEEPYWGTRYHATARICLKESYLYDKTINLINSEQRYVRAGQEGLVYNDAMRQIEGNLMSAGGYSGWTDGCSGPFYRGTTTALSYAGGQYRLSNALFDISRSVPTASEIRPRTIEYQYYMRIL